MIGAKNIFQYIHSNVFIHNWCKYPCRNTHSFSQHMNFSSKNPGESFACLGSSDWTDPSPPFHPATLLRGQPQVEQIQHCRKFQNLNKLSSFQQQWVRGTINRIRLPVLGIRSTRLFLWCALRFLRNSAIQIGKGLSYITPIYMSLFLCWNQPNSRTMWVIIDLWCRAWNSLTERCGQGRSCPR